MLDPYNDESQQLKYKRKYLIINIATLIVIIAGCFMIFNSAGGNRPKILDFKNVQETQPAQPVIPLYESANKVILAFTVTAIVLLITVKALRFIARSAHHD